MLAPVILHQKIFNKDKKKELFMRKKKMWIYSGLLLFEGKAKVI